MKLDNNKGFIAGFIIMIVFLFVGLLVYVLVMPLAQPFIGDVLESETSALTKFLFAGIPLFLLFGLIAGTVLR